MRTRAQENTGLSSQEVSRIMRKKPGLGACGFAHPENGNIHGRFHHNIFIQQADTQELLRVNNSVGAKYLDNLSATTYTELAQHFTILTYGYPFQIL